ncbi:MAG TPA: DNA replication complex GINS family protein [Methanomicrobia archaeon]|nr:DNA replication complex GINS family protein [Methanomicrobia archaeon]
MIEDILKKEKEEVKLQKLSPNFYSDLLDYIENLRSKIETKEGFEKKVLQRELRVIKTKFSELLALRVGKIVSLKDQNFMPEEEKVFKEISELIKKYKKTLSEETVPRTLKVKLEKDLPVIIGPDLKTYGPFRKDEEVELPVEMGILLIKNRIGIKGE